MWPDVKGMVCYTIIICDTIIMDISATIIMNNNKCQDR